MTTTETPAPEPTPEEIAAVAVTPAVRAAVQDADCADEGHLVDIAVGYGPAPSPEQLLGRPEADGEQTCLPHVFCRRCRRVWIIIALSAGRSYDAAEAALTAQMRSNDPVVALARERKDRRRERRQRDDRAQADHDRAHREWEAEEVQRAEDAKRRAREAREARRGGAV